MTATLIDHNAHDPPSVARARYTARARVTTDGVTADVLVLLTEAGIAELAEAATRSETGRVSRLGGGLMAMRLPPGR